MVRLEVGVRKRVSVGFRVRVGAGLRLVMKSVPSQLGRKAVSSTWR